MGEIAAFEPFGAAHRGALAAAVVAALAAFFLGRRDRRGAAAVWLAGMVAVHEVLNITLHALVFGYSWADSLPFNFCRANMLLCAYLLWRRSYAAFEVAYFWAVIGAPIAFFAPDLRQAFPHPLFFTFFLGHGLALTAVAYAIGAFGFAPRWVSIAKSFGAAMALALLAIAVNAIWGTNYLYLARAPEHAGWLEWFEPWPGYPIGIAALSLLAAVLVFLPFVRRSG